MKRFPIARFLAVSSTYLLAGAPLAAMAQTSASTSFATNVAAGTTAAPSPDSTGPAQQLISSFAVFAGSAENAASLANGLRTGTLVSLAAAPSTGGGIGANTSIITGDTVSFMPPTRPMGWGNVRHALTLAQRELAAQGISNPTPDQLQSALMGGSVVTATGQTAMLSGTLVLRSQGMGWGQIAQKVGVPLGNAASIQASSHGSSVVTARGYRVGAVTSASGDVLRSSHLSGEGGSQVRIGAGATMPAWSNGGQPLPVASTPVVSGFGLGVAGNHGGLGNGGHGRGR